MKLWDTIKKAITNASNQSESSMSKTELVNQQYLQSRQKEISRLERKYDFSSITGIESIPISAAKNDDCFVTGRVEYYLRLKATEYKKAKKMDLAIACLRKSNELMMVSPVQYSAKDYMRLVEYLKMDRQFDEARRVEADLKEKLPALFDITLLNKQNFKRAILEAKKLHTDLLEMSMHECTCGECSKYQGRIYSISGKDSRYPKLPDSFKKFGGVHPGCQHTFYPYLDGSPTVSGKDPIAYSNRPFVDERTPEVIAQYEKQRLEQEQYAIDKNEFDQIREMLPDIAPKSFGGYRRMKNMNSATYQKLKKAAQDIGLKLT